jgi:hypothetical protein
VANSLEVALPLGSHLNKLHAAMGQETEETKAQTSITLFFTYSLFLHQKSIKKCIFYSFIYCGISAIWNTLGPCPNNIPYERLYCSSIAGMPDFMYLDLSNVP